MLPWKSFFAEDKCSFLKAVVAYKLTCGVRYSVSGHLAVHYDIIKSTPLLNSAFEQLL